MKKDHGVVKRAIVTPDKHAPLHDRAAIKVVKKAIEIVKPDICLLYTSPSPRDKRQSRMPSSA